MLSFEREVHQRMTPMTEIDVDGMVAQVLPGLPEAESQLHELRLRPVKSYVASGKTLQSSKFSGVAVPSFAVHWGVVVGRTMYHLAFQNRQDSELEWSDTSRHRKPIRLAVYIWERGTECEDFPSLGHTKFGHEELLDIGDRLIEAFGDYHRLFWNCQVFAECFLRIITGNQGSRFGRCKLHTNMAEGRYTSVDAAQLFLCAFVVTLPTAITMRITYENKRKALESEMYEVMDLVTQVERVAREEGMDPKAVKEVTSRNNELWRLETIERKGNINSTETGCDCSRR
jgi:hypothetical protein